MPPKYKYPLFALLAFMLFVTLYFLLVPQTPKTPPIEPIKTISTEDIKKAQESLKVYHSIQETNEITKAINKKVVPDQRALISNQQEADAFVHDVVKEAKKKPDYILTHETKKQASNGTQIVEANYYGISTEKKNKIDAGLAYVNKKPLMTLTYTHDKTHVSVYYDINSHKVDGYGISRTIWQK